MNERERLERIHNMWEWNHPTRPERKDRPLK